MIVVVEQLQFSFNSDVDPFQYESGGKVIAGWPVGQKVVDIVANQPGGTPQVLWLIEAKDFRIITNPPKPANTTGLAQSMKEKAEHSLLGLASMASMPSNHPGQAHATAALAAPIKRVVLYLEEHPHEPLRSSLFPARFTANIWMQLKSLVAHIDDKPLVLNIARTGAAGVPWSVV